MRFEIVVIGTSLGGLAAIETLLEGLSADFPLAVVVAQHRSPQSGSGLCAILQRHSPLVVIEPHDKEAIQPGQVYVAPADYHLLVERGYFMLSTQGVVSYARPSIDVLFESAADAYGGGVIGVILTGANHDGAQGAARIQEAGGSVIVQDPVSAECAIMPIAAIQQIKPDYVIPLSQVAKLLTELIKVPQDGNHASRPEGQYPPRR